MARHGWYDHDVCVGYRDVEKFDPHPPLSMLLRFTLEQNQLVHR